MVSTVARSRSNQNIVITTTNEFTAQDLIQTKEFWGNFIPHQSYDIGATWHKVIVHGIPTSCFNSGSGMAELRSEIETFNQNLRGKVIGEPRWITLEARRQGKLHGSIIVSFST